MREPCRLVDRGVPIFRHFAKAIDDRVELAFAIERLAAPRVIEVALLDELQARASQQIAGASRLAIAVALSQHAAHGFAWISELALEEALEGLVEETLLRGFVGGHEERIDARFDGALAEKLGAERVDRPDVRGLELADRLIEPRAHFVARVLARAFDFGAKSELHLARGFFRERDGHRRGERGFAAREEAEDARDELRRLSGSRGRFDDERRLEIAADRVARFLIDEAQSRSLKRESGTIPSAGFREVRCSSYGPQMRA